MCIYVSCYRFKKRKLISTICSSNTSTSTAATSDSPVPTLEDISVSSISPIRHERIEGQAGGKGKRDEKEADKKEEKSFSLLGAELDDMLFGLCPEDFSLNLSTSYDRVLSSPNTAQLVCHQTASSTSKYMYGDKLVQKCESSSCGLTLQLTAVESDSKPLYSYDPETFFGLPIKVKECLKEHRNIEQLYGECFVEF